MPVEVMPIEVMWTVKVPPRSATNIATAADVPGGATSVAPTAATASTASLRRGRHRDCQREYKADRQDRLRHDGASE
jgi:hypothetical protein